MFTASVCVAYRINGVSGCILVNGVERSAEEIRRKSCYIPQDCYFMELLTTRETLNIAASFQLSRKIRSKEKQFMVREHRSQSLMLFCKLVRCSKNINHNEELHSLYRSPNIVR